MVSAHSQVRRSTRRQLHILRKKSVGGAKALAHSSGSGSAVEQRRPGDRLGGIPSSSLSTTPKQQQEQRQHLSPTAAAAAAANSGAAPAPKDALASELWAWLGGVGSGRSCSAERPKRSSQRSGGGGEWRGAFYNRECRAVANRVGKDPLYCCRLYTVVALLVQVQSLEGEEQLDYSTFVRVFWTRVTAHLRPRQLHTFTFARCACSPLLLRNPASLTPLVWLIQPVLLLIRRSTCLNTQVWVTSRDETPSRPQEERFTCEAGERGQGDLPAQGRRRHPSGVSSRYGKRMRRASSPGDVDGRSGAEKATKSIPQVASIATRESVSCSEVLF